MKELRILGLDATVSLIVKHCADLSGIYDMNVSLVEEPEGPSALPPPQVAQPTPRDYWAKPVTHVEEVKRKKTPAKGYAYSYLNGKTIHPEHYNMQRAKEWIKAQPDKRMFTVSQMANESGVNMRGGHRVVVIRSLEKEGWIAFVDRGGPIGAKRYWKGDKLRDFGQVQSAGEPATVS